ncbi:DNA polymerase III subunit [Pelobium manganitolerans]|uniref:DNA polymerase III subunit n=1 Tax=Pelobium manganitolerans TaxID=1842495 RepID=UPI003FA34BB3
MQFSDIVGQEAVKKHLIQTVKDERISHAQLFLGAEGVGALPLALAYAQYICCENKQENDSCGQCASCRKYGKLVHPDLHFSYPFFAKHKEDTALNFIEQWRKAFLQNPYMGMDEWREQLEAENKQANINIAEAHAIIKKLSLKAFEAEYKVLILWMPEYLEKEGNALLKLIEEPPQKTLFLLVAQNQEQILNTIISRTQLVKIPKLKKDEIAHYLSEIKGVEPALAKQLAYLSNGSLQSALHLLQHQEHDYHNLFLSWLRACWGNKGLEIVSYSEGELAKMGRENQKNFLRYAVSMMRECALFKAETPGLINVPESELKFVSSISPSLSLAQIQEIITELEKAQYHIERNANPKILFLDVSLILVKILKFKTLRPTADSIIL